MKVIAMKCLFNKINKRAIVASIITASILMVFCYLITNLGFSISTEGAWVMKVNKSINKIYSQKKHVPDSVLLVNISYDRELIPINDSDGFPIGDIDITNREALYRFLSILKQRNDYKYVFLDVFFQEGYQSPSDEKLFPLISKMDNLAISCHRDATIDSPELLQGHAFISDYTVTKTSKTFMKYELLPDGQKSVVLHMYNECKGKDITKYGPVYFDGNRLCNSTLFAKQIINFKGSYDDEGYKNYYNLSADLLMDEEELLSTSLLKDKYIFIGSMELNDVHSSSEGALPGVVISANTFLSVMQGKHIIPYFMMFVLFAVLFCISYQIYTGKTIANWFKCLIEKYRININPVVFSYFLTWVSYMSILSLACIISYSVYGVMYDIFFTATLFQHIDYIVSNKDTFKKAKGQSIRDFILKLILK